jgi:hypothetical protein
MTDNYNKRAYAGQLNSLHIWEPYWYSMTDNNNNNNNNHHAYAGQLNSFTHLRSLLVLHDRGILGPSTSVADGRWYIALVNSTGGGSATVGVFSLVIMKS